MPTGSRVDFGFRFASEITGRPTKSQRRKDAALIRFIESGGSQSVTNGVQVFARWRNPEDKHARSRQWKTAEDESEMEEFYSTMSDLLHAVVPLDEIKARLKDENSKRPNPNQKQKKTPGSKRRATGNRKGRSKGKPSKVGKTGRQKPRKVENRKPRSS